MLKVMSEAPNCYIQCSHRATITLPMKKLAASQLFTQLLERLSSAPASGFFKVIQRQSAPKIIKLIREALLIFDRLVSYQLINASNLFTLTDHLKEAQCAKKVEEAKKHDTVRKDLPTYSADEVSKHSDE